ncbi:MAG: SpoIIE family protein phosphatase [Acidobacteria bacterium]|nr:SpoIIE family protein phosphatase [Acidobacteriota bacterium]
MSSPAGHSRISEVIFRFAARIAQEQEPEALLRLNADMARDLVGADRCSIWLLDPAASELHTQVAHGVGEIRVPAGHGLVGACVEQGEPILVNNTAADERFFRKVDQGSGYQTDSVLAIPLRGTGGRIIGAFQALNKPGGFTAEDVTLLGLAASYSATAIESQKLREEAETARLLLRELEIAKEVQAMLLPRELPRMPFAECAAYCRPAKFVGGDYYDAVATPDGSLAFTLGDVSGKGVPAAVLMASIQGALRTPLMQGPDSLAALMTTVNRSVYGSTPAARYSTLFCAILEAGGARLRYVNAGQCAPMLLRVVDGTPQVRRLETGGAPVGLLPIARYEEGVEELAAGDLLVGFSDGISEATNIRGGMWDESEVQELLVENRGRPAAEITELIVKAADEFTGDAEQADDMTIVALRIGPQNQ